MSFDSPTSSSATKALSQLPGFGDVLKSTMLGSNGSGIENDIKPYTMPQGTKPGAKNQRTTFLGADMIPGPASGVSGGKTLLGL